MQLAHIAQGNTSAVLKQQSKILIVEDEVLFARAVMRRLQKAGYDCEHVETLLAAAAALKQFVPDLVLLDMRLPDGNGLDLLADLVAKNAAVIVMTAHGEVSDAVNAIKLGAVDYLKKPIDLEELLLSVQKAEAAAVQSNSLDYSRQRNAHAAEGVELLGDSVAIQSVKSQIQSIAQLVSSCLLYTSRCVKETVDNQHAFGIIKASELVDRDWCYFLARYHNPKSVLGPYRVRLYKT